MRVSRGVTSDPVMVCASRGCLVRWCRVLSRYRGFLGLNWSCWCDSEGRDSRSAIPSVTVFMYEWNSYRAPLVISVCTCILYRALPVVPFMSYSSSPVLPRPTPLCTRQFSRTIEGEQCSIIPPVDGARAPRTALTSARSRLHRSLTSHSPVAMVLSSTQSRLIAHVPSIWLLPPAIAHDPFVWLFTSLMVSGSCEVGVPLTGEQQLRRLRAAPRPRAGSPACGSIAPAPPRGRGTARSPCPRRSPRHARCRPCRPWLPCPSPCHLWLPRPSVGPCHPCRPWPRPPGPCRPRLRVRRRRRWCPFPLRLAGTTPVPCRAGHGAWVW